MTFSEAIEICFKKYSQGKGRARRSEYWYFYLFSLLLGLVLYYIASVSNHSTPMNLVVDLVNIAIVVPTVTVAVRRLHDTNRSAWNLLWGLLPVVGLIVVIVYLAQPGTIGPNNYGD